MPISWRVTRAGLASGPIRLKIVRRAMRRRIGVMRVIAGWWLPANRKAMPMSASVCSAIAPARIMSRPSASSVSAAPALLDAARLPCLATGTPQAAVMESAPPFAITHAPGHMLVTDARDADYQVP